MQAPTVVEIPYAPYIAGMSAWSDGHIWVSTGATIVVSEDDGASWRKLAPRPSDVGRIDLVSPRAAWIMEGDGLAVTSDAGGTWATADTPPGIRYPRMDFVNATTGWVAGVDRVAESPTYNTYRLYRTVDAGSSWEERDLPCRGRDDNPLLAFTDDRAGMLLCPGKVLPDSQEKRLFSTADGGRTWSPVAATRGGLLGLKTLPAAGWAQTLAAFDEDHAWVGMALGPIYSTEDGWRTLEPRPSLGSSGSPSLVMTAPGRGYAVGRSGVTSIVWETADNGDSWRQVLRTGPPFPTPLPN